MSAPSLALRALELFDVLVELMPAARAQRLQALAAADPALHDEVAGLLAADDADGMLERELVLAWADDDADDDSADPMLDQRIGPWRILGIVGRGGMGAVYRGERVDGEFQQQAAIKLIRLGMDRPELRRRFLRERQILARLQHPNIAALHDGGVADNGAPYFAMELVDGEPIDRWCDAQRLGLRERVRLFLQVCAAVQHAHQNLIVHRDLKPNNILITPDGQAKLLDFGIAKLLEGDDADTQTRDRPLTPEYAAPEQLHGEPITTATDLYALGVVLYGLLAGAHPFAPTARTPLQRQLAMLEREPEAIASAAARLDPAQAQARQQTPRALAAALRGDLAAIVHRCLETEPLRRYSSAEALAIDLRAWLDGRPVGASPGRRTYRFIKFVRRNRAISAFAALMTLAIVTGIAATLWQAEKAQRQARIALAAQHRTEAALKRSNAIRDLMFDLFRIGTPGQAHDRLPNSEELLANAIRQVPTRFKNDPDTEVEFLTAIAEVHVSRGNPSPELHERVLQLRAASRRQEPVAYAIAQQKLAFNRAANQRIDESRDLFVAAIASLRTHAPDSLVLARAYNDRLVLHSLQRDSASYLRDAQMAWTILRRHPQATAKDRFDGLISLEEGYSLVGRHEQALTHIDQAFALGRVAFGETNFDVGLAMVKRSNVLTRLGRFQEAEQNWRQVVRVFTRQDEHPDLHVLSAWKGLEQLYHRTGRYADALQARDIADRLSPAASDSAYKKISLARNQVLRARNLIGLGRYAAADELLRPAMMTLEEQPLYDSSRLLLLARTTHVRSACGKPAKQQNSDALKRSFALLRPTSSPETKADLHGLAGLCALQAGDAAAALAHLDLATAAKLPRGEDPYVAERLLWRGQALAALGREPEARGAWQDASARLRALGLNAHPLLAELDRALGGPMSDASRLTTAH